MNKYGEVFSNLNLCTRCGACCTTWKVCFPAVEADTRKAAGVPIELAVPVNESLLAMKGTKLRRKRCCALKGQIGHWVSCAIYGAVEKQENTTRKGMKLTIKMNKAGACRDVLSQRLLIATFEDLVKLPSQHHRYRVQKRY